MPTTVLAIAKNAFIESVRQPVFFILVLVSGALQAFNNMLSTYSLGHTDTSEVSGDEKLFLDVGLATALVCGLLLACFIATAVISREIEEKTALTVISKPVGRTTFILGKFLGVSGAILAAVSLMLAYFLFALQHGVMSRALDHYDFPVLVFGVGTTALALGVAAWGNYFYGWAFTSAAVYLLLPLTIGGLFVSLAFGPDWKLHASVAQALAKEVKPTVLTACFAVMLALLVLTSVAIAASTRLGQVMTIVVCFGVFLFGLLSNHLVGRRAFQNSPVETVLIAEPRSDFNQDLRDRADEWAITLRGEPRVNLKPGDLFYFAEDPSGIAMVAPRQAPFAGDVNDDEAVRNPQSGPALVIRSAEANGRSLVIANAGGLALQRPPRPGDFVFAGPTKVNRLARLVWGVTPNVQFFWLVDAVTQGHTVPLRYATLLLGYTAAQIAAFLALAVFLFQTREVG